MSFPSYLPNEVYTFGTPVFYVFTCVSFLFLLKYLTQEGVMFVLNNLKEAEPNTFDNIKKVNLDDLPKDMNNKRSIYEKLRRIKKEDFEFIVIFSFIMIAYLLGTDFDKPTNFTIRERKELTKNFSVRDTEYISWSDLSIANSVLGCIFIIAFLVLRIVSLVVVFAHSKTLSFNIMRIITYVYFLIFGVFTFLMIFIFGHYVDLPAKYTK